MRFRLSAIVFSIPLLTALIVGAPGDSARAAAFTDSAGRRVVLPDHIGRVLPAERNAEVLLFVLVPDKLPGAAGHPARGPAPLSAARMARRRSTLKR